MLCSELKVTGRFMFKLRIFSTNWIPLGPNWARSLSILIDRVTTQRARFATFIQSYTTIIIYFIFLHDIIYLEPTNPFEYMSTIPTDV